MKLRFEVSFCAAIIVALTLPASAQTAAPFEVNVMLPLTGPAALLGKAMMQATQVAEKTINARGGIKGRPIKFVIADDESSPQTGLQLANGFISKKVPIFLGSAFAQVCDSYAPLLAKAGPVNYCMSPLVHPAAGSFVFSIGASGRDDAIAMARYFRDRGLNRIAMLTSTDASGQEMEAAFPAVLELPDFKALQIVDRERFGLGDTSVSGQLAKIKAANPQAVLTWTTGAPFGNVLRGLRDSGLDSLPIAASNGNMLYGLLAQLDALIPGELLFPGYRSMTTMQTGRGAISDAQGVYLTAYRDAGIRPDIAPASTWDMFMLVSETLGKLPADATASQLRAAIAGIHGWSGINGTYNFRDSQRGIGADALVIDRWDTSKKEFVIVSKPGGAMH